jgi:hypothetical protein
MYIQRSSSSDCALSETSFFLTSPMIVSLGATNNENCYAMTFGGDYGYKDGTESIILSVCTERMILSAWAESLVGKSIWNSVGFRN